ncbi:bacterio-opsin activator domain-containing protein [Halopiger djelfimassiliensis]|uniref:bacterio-opsin activator domain-containing protein n=1 Tax=Halopiger djelfimassiliensis TaxID=1293047 RepID=UPI00067785C1|nr:bacterio-opsin activator domain-containing protein [Halopiger djelfimassiliensis]
MTEHSSNRNDPAADSHTAPEIGPTLEDALGGLELVAIADDHAVSVLDPDGCVRAWNEGMQRLTGYDGPEILGMHYRTLFPAGPREAGRPDHLLERARAEGHAEDEGWRIRSDGRRLWVRDVIAPVRNDTVADETGPAEELVGYAWCLHDRTEKRERERELREEQALTESIFAAQPDLVYAFDAEGNYLEWNDRVPEVTGYTETELAEMDPLEFVAPDHRDRIADAIGRILETDEHVTAEADLLTKDGSRIPYEFNSARIVGGDGHVRGFTGVGRDVSDRKHRERELERLERLNGVIRVIDETMVAAETREQIETAVVEEFAAADAYRFAGICRADTDDTSDRRAWQARVRAGADAPGADDVLPSFLEPPAESETRPPLDTGAVQCYRTLRDSAVDAWRADARERDYGAVAVVPIVASNRLYGALVIAAVEPTAFTDREREILREFGGTIGHAINAMEVRQLLYTDTVVELEFESADRRAVCIDLSARVGCQVTLEHVVALADEEFVYYVSVTDVSPERLRELAAKQPSIREVRAIDSTSGARESHWEVVVTGSTLPGLLADYGARIRSQTAADGISTIRILASPVADVRELVEAVTVAYPDTRLASKRTVERPPVTRGDFRRAVGDSLTAKQRTALETAYYGGYFEWPTRNSDASELADRLGIARQTFHQHLRVAQNKLLAAYFEAAI